MTDALHPEAEKLVFARVGVEPVVRWKPLYSALVIAHSVDAPLTVALEIPGQNGWDARDRFTSDEACRLANFISTNIEGIVADSAYYAAVDARNVADDMRRIGCFLLSAEMWFRDACANGDEVHVIPVSSDTPEVIDY